MRQITIGLVLATACACGGNSFQSPTSPTASAQPPATSGFNLPARAGTLNVESFVVVEFEYPGRPGWFYAPQMRVSSPADGGGVIVTEMDLRVPGLGPAPPFIGVCKPVPSGSIVDLIPEVYGDYEYTIDQSGVRAVAGDATLVITFRDGLGTVTTLNVRGPVVPGELPKTHSSGPPGPFC